MSIPDSYDYTKLETGLEKILDMALQSYKYQNDHLQWHQIRTIRHYLWISSFIMTAIIVFHQKYDPAKTWFVLIFELPALLLSLLVFLSGIRSLAGKDKSTIREAPFRQAKRIQEFFNDGKQYWRYLVFIIEKIDEDIDQLIKENKKQAERMRIMSKLLLFSAISAVIGLLLFVLKDEIQAIITAILSRILTVTATWV